MLCLLVGIIPIILVHINAVNCLSPASQIKIDLEESLDSLAKLNIPCSEVHHYQKIVDILLPKIHHLFLDKQLYGKTEKPFFPIALKKENSRSRQLGACGLFAISSAVLIIGLLIVLVNENRLKLELN